MKPSRQQVRQRLRQGTYLLPAAFTIANMLMGFYAIVLGMDHRFEPAALLIFGAAVVDALDGRIARMSGTESAFGREYDSLADVLTFGMAPALLAYNWGLGDWDRLGWLVPLFYLVCTATRLARFNVQASADFDARFFVGLPAPAAACSVASVLFFIPNRSALEEPWLRLVAAALMLALAVLGLLMVSTFRYSSFKKIDLRKRWSYRGLIPVAAVLFTAVWQPPAFFLAVGILYTASGPLGWVFSRLRRRPGGDGEVPS